MKKYAGVIMGLLLLVTNGHASYFNTDRPQKIMGSLLTEAWQVDEIRGFSNAFAFIPKTPGEIIDYLNINQYGLLTVISIDKLLFDRERGLYHADTRAIMQAIHDASRQGDEMLFMLDEPLWTVRNACMAGKKAACDDIENGYTETLATLRTVGQQLRQEFPGSGVMHIEAWTELVLQKKKHPDANVIMLDDVEYLGFDCYGKFDRCGSDEYGYYSQLEFGIEVWNTLHALEADNPIGRKIFLIPGAFLNERFFQNTDEIKEQLFRHAQLLDQYDKVAGFGIFLWGDMMENDQVFQGARGLQAVVDYIIEIAGYFKIGYREVVDNNVTTLNGNLSIGNLKQQTEVVFPQFQEALEQIKETLSGLFLD